MWSLTVLKVQINQLIKPDSAQHIRIEVVHVFTGLCFRKKQNTAAFTAARNNTNSSEENGNRSQTNEQRQKDQEMLIGPSDVSAYLF